MRMRKFFYALGIGCMLSACSSHEEPAGQEQPDFSKGNKCISISIVTTAGEDTRADEEDTHNKPYEDGDPAEYDIKSVGLYLFNRQGECVDAEYYTPANFTKTDTPDDENLTTLCTIEVELSGNRVYDRIIAVLNPNSALVNGNGLIAMSEDDLIKYRDAYSGKFTMSNSVYINDAHYSGTAGVAPHIATPIGAENIYTKEKEEKDMTPDELTALNNTRKDKAINIYVERVCSKILVEKQPSLSTYYVSMDEQGNTTKEMTVMVTDGENMLEKTITVVPVFKGIRANVTSSKAYLLKRFSDDLTYDFGDYIEGFEWNDYDRHRSYWETTINGSLDKTTFNYYNWQDLPNPWENDPSASYVVYPNPNTAAPTDYDANTNEATRTTKLMVGAQLYYYYNDDQAQTKHELDLVMFGGAYWMADYLLFHAAERVVKHLEHIEEFLPETLSAADVAAVKAKLAERTTDYFKSKINLIRLTSGKANAYLAKLNIMTNTTDKIYPDFLEGLDETLKGKVRGTVNTQIQNTLDEITNRQIQYWKKGMTYFYVPIRHQGFTGLSGEAATDPQGNPVPTYLNGVVRNHVYVVKVSQIWGLGTPVINPTDPIDPERPDNAPKSYMTAKINVLKWKVVKNDAVLH